MREGRGLTVKAGIIPFIYPALAANFKHLKYLMIRCQSETTILAIFHSENTPQNQGKSTHEVFLLVLLALVWSNIKLFKSYCSFLTHLLLSLCFDLTHT